MALGDKLAPHKCKMDGTYLLCQKLAAILHGLFHSIFFFPRGSRACKYSGSHTDHAFLTAYASLCFHRIPLPHSFPNAVAIWTDSYRNIGETLGEATITEALWQRTLDPRLFIFSNLSPSSKVKSGFWIMRLPYPFIRCSMQLFLVIWNCSALL